MGNRPAVAALSLAAVLTISVVLFAQSSGQAPGQTLRAKSAKGSHEPRPFRSLEREVRHL